MYTTINVWSILVASVVSFVVGAIWYSPILFGKEWMSLIKVSDSDIAAAKSGVWKLYIVQFVMTVITFCVLGFIVSAVDAMNGSDAAFFAFLVWLGFIATTAVGQMIWEKKPFKLILINSVGMLVSLVIGGAIIGSWRM